MGPLLISGRWQTCTGEGTFGSKRSNNWGWSSYQRATVLSVLSVWARQSSLSKARQFALQMSGCEKENTAWWKKAREKQKLRLKTCQEVSSNYCAEIYWDYTRYVRYFTLSYWNMQKIISHLRLGINHRFFEKKKRKGIAFSLRNVEEIGFCPLLAWQQDQIVCCCKVDLILASAVVQNILPAFPLWK